MDRNSKRAPNSIAIRVVSLKTLDVHECVTYRELESLASRVGNALHEIGVEAEQRIAMLIDDGPEFATVFFGALKIGAVPAILSPYFNETQLHYLLNDSRAKVLFANNDYLEKIYLIRHKLESTKTIVNIKNRFKTTTLKNGFVPYDDILSRQSNFLKTRKTSKDDSAFWLYTSGSTGIPKAVVHQHHDVYFSAKPFSENILRATNKDCFFSASKLYFSGGLSFGLYVPFSVGASTVLFSGKIRARDVIHTINNTKPSFFFSVPTLYAQMIAVLKNKPHVDFSKVKSFFSGGEPLSKVVFDEWKTLVRKEIVEGYGAAEFGRCLCNTPGNARANSCGRIIKGYDVRILGQDGRELSTNEIGTLYVKSGANFSCYWHMQEVTKRTVVGEWINTGDLFYKNSEGFFFYCGRSDFAFKIHGLWVSPIEIEEAIVGTGFAKECCVVQMEGRNGLAILTAYVVAKKRSETFSENTLSIRIIDEISKKLVKYKIPEQIFTLKRLPKNSNGKLDRTKVIEMTKKDRKA